MDDPGEATDSRGGTTVLTEPPAELSNERQQIDYRQRREQCLEWLITFGEDPQKVDGYVQTSIKRVPAGWNSFIGGDCRQTLTVLSGTKYMPPCGTSDQKLRFRYSVSHSPSSVDCSHSLRFTSRYD